VHGHVHSLPRWRFLEGHDLDQDLGRDDCLAAVWSLLWVVLKGASNPQMLTVISAYNIFFQHLVVSFLVHSLAKQPR
jgi:hypothetical protein